MGYSPWCHKEWDTTEHSRYYTTHNREKAIDTDSSQLKKNKIEQIIQWSVLLNFKHKKIFVVNQKTNKLFLINPCRPSSFPAAARAPVWIRRDLSPAFGHLDCLAPFASLLSLLYAALCLPSGQLSGTALSESFCKESEAGPCFSWNNQASYWLQMWARQLLEAAPSPGGWPQSREKEIHRPWKQTRLPKGKGGGRDNLGVWG